ncbi:MAG: hypothetical protein HC897_15645 [Thermoanaerobaculia bacterium]|nr:hypothetical protein [Thermoanaerobaculia bacterium]
MSIKKFAFVLMPFSSQYDDIYALGIRDPCEQLSLRCERVDEQHFQGHIIDRVYDQIMGADIVIAELTERNPNVYYELGFARAMRKRIITLVKSVQELPFDLRSYPHIVYEGSISGLRAKLSERVKNSLTDPAEKLKLVTADTPVVFRRSADFQGHVGRLIDGAKTEITLSAVHFNITVSDRREQLIAAVCRGVNVTLVVLDPDSTTVEITADSYGMRRGELKSECQTSLELLRGLRDEVRKINPGCPTPLRLLVTSHLPRGRYMLFDPDSGDGHVVVVHYLDLTRSSHSPFYLFEAGSDTAEGYIRACREAVRQGRDLG